MADDRFSSDPYLSNVTEYDVDRRLRFVDLRPEDLANIEKIRDDVAGSADEHAAVFFDFLSQLPEAAGVFAKPAVLADARRLKRDHLLALASGRYDKTYVEQRVQLGLIYSRSQLDTRVFLGAFNAMMASIGGKVFARFAKDPKTAFACLTSLNKVAFFDLGVITDVMIADRERTIMSQQEAIRELSTPTLQVRDRLLVLPIIGVLDTYRARQLTEGLLQAIRARRARVVVMDITGVPTVDSKVANHLLQTVAASRLMGATVIVTGLSADVAQSLVTLGVDLAALNTVGDLQGGLEEAERLLGYELKLRDGSTSRGVA
jgi:rsbT co-antagonist protein RsbR